MKFLIFQISFSAEISDDSSLIAIGFADANIKVWSLTPSKLREMKPVDQLKEIDKEAEDIMVRMMDDRTAETARNLLGHCGPVYRCSFSPDKTLLLSCSEDTTVRLWSFHTWTCVVRPYYKLKKEIFTKSILS